MLSNLRSLLKSPGFTALSVVTLALGIGVNTSMFSVLNTFLLRPPPFAEPERLFQVNRTGPQTQNGAHVPANVPEILAAAGDSAELAVFRYWGFTLSEPDSPADIYTSHRVSPNYFDVLGIKPAMGRQFRPEEDAPGQNHVIMISHNFWQTHFNGDPAIVGRIVRLDGEPTEIIGVLPKNAEAPLLYGQVYIYRPLGLNTEERASYSDSSLRIIGRLRPGVTSAQAQVRFDAVAARLTTDHPRENGDLGLRMVSLQSTALGPTGKNMTFLMLGLSGFVLLIACANLANLLLTRAISRAREFAIRAALGASRSQLIRPLLGECLLLASAGCGLGMILCGWITSWMANRFSGNGTTQAFELDWHVLSFAVAAAFGTALLFGVTPALLVARIRTNEALKSGTRGSTHGHSHQRFRQGLIVGQFALALILLAGAAVFVRGIDHLIKREAGWHPEGLLSGKLALPPSLSADPDRTLRFYQQVQQRLAALPGVVSTSVDIEIPVYGFPGPRGYLVEGRNPPAAGHEPAAYTNAVSPEYFATVGTRLLRGRTITATDARLAPPVVVINETMARVLFPDGDAIGHRLTPVGQAEPHPAEIVGVVEDVRFVQVGTQPTAFQVYKPLSQETWGYVSATLRAPSTAIAVGLSEPFRRAIAELNPDLPVSGLSPVPVFIESNLSDFRTISQLLVGFAMLGLFLAALGIYGVIARTVLQRTNEIGIRMALGAQLRDIVRLILGAGVRMALLGTTIGLAAATVLSWFLAQAMPDIAAQGVVGIPSAAAVLFLVAMLASWFPARRATKVDPMVALRAE